MARLLVSALSVLCGFGVSSRLESCSEPDALRLIPTPSIVSADGNVGRLEVCMRGTWGTFTLQSQDHFWSEKNIQVACLQLGFSGGLNSIPPSHIPVLDKSPTNLSVHVGAVMCYGEEKVITRCNLNRLTDMTDPFPTDHHEDVFIVCRPKQVDYSDLHVAGEQIGDVRLFRRFENAAGAVEILTDRFGWTGICPDGWANTDARIVCQSLGYDFGRVQNIPGAGVAVNHSVHDAFCSDISPNTSPSRVQAKLCSFQEVVQPEDCSASSGYAGVLCGASRTSSQDQVRIFGVGLFDSTRAVGVVEVFLDNRWGMVCANQPDELARVNAKILCTRFFSDDRHARPLQIPMSSLRRYESHLKPLWANRLVCPPTSSDFNDCVLEEPLGFSNCSSQQVLAVDCGPTDVRRENNGTAIIVGVGVTVFVFIIVFFFFGTVMYTLVKRKRNTTAIATDGFALTRDLGQSGSVAVNSSHDDDVKEEDDKDDGMAGALPNHYENS